MRTIEFTDTTFRDAHQSLLATRMTTNEILGIANVADKIGYHSFEMWGGATFDSCIRYLNEDPWERLRKIRKSAKRTKLQMLLRGQNILGYKNYPDDIVEKFVFLAVKNGIDIIRIFDALNDMRNLRTAIEATLKSGAHAQGAICYTISPVHTLELYIRNVQDLVEMGCQSICIKDMAGLMTPKNAYDLVKAIKNRFDIPVQVHAHFTTGLADMAYYAAIEAGADVVDTAISSLAYGTSQPGIEPIAYSIEEMPDLKTRINFDLLPQVAEYFREVRSNHKDTDANIKGIDIRVLASQVPGGMLSNLMHQLAAQNKMDKYGDVLREIPRVRKDLGYPPLVTPTSQLVGVQAVLNVINGERYKVIPNEVKEYIKGFYGRPPAPIDPDLKEKAIGDERTIDVRPANLLPPVFDEMKRKLGNLAETDEDVLTYALFPTVARNFLSLRYQGKIGVDFSLVEEMEKISSDIPYYPV